MKRYIMLLLGLLILAAGNNAVSHAPFFFPSPALQNTGKYLEAGIENDRDFQKWFKRLQGYVSRENRNKVADLVNYPVDVRINKQDIKIRNKKEFLSYYNQLFTKEVKEAVVKQKIKKAKVSFKGVMIGNGEMWVNFIEGKPGYWITAVNN